MMDKQPNAKALRKMSRVELLEILYAQSQEIERLQSDLDSARKQLDALTDASALADTARELAELIRSGGLSQPCAVLPSEGSPDADTVLAQARAEAERLLAQTRGECDAMLEAAKAESQQWWAETAKKLDAFYQERTGLREMLADEYTQEV